MAEKQPLQGMGIASGKRTREHHYTNRPFKDWPCSGPEDEHEHCQYRTVAGGVLGVDDFDAEEPDDEPSHTPSAVDRADLAHHVDIPKVGARMQGPVGATAAEVNNAPAAQLATATAADVLDAVRDLPVWGFSPPSVTGWRILPEYAYQALTERLASAEQRSTELQDQVGALERVSDDHTKAINDLREQMTAERVLQRRQMADFKREVYACGWPAPC